MSDTIEKPRVETRVAPAKGWRNWGRAIKPYNSNDIGGIRRAGSLFCGRNLWPSKDVAESRAAEMFKRPNHAFCEGVAEYLGAFPEGTTP